MDPASVKSTLQNLAFGNVMAAAARNYQKELLANEKAPATSSVNQEVDLDELMDDPELEKLHADRIAALKVRYFLGLFMWVCGILHGFVLMFRGFDLEFE
ncbi:PREDICTED: thioredoxin [Prunus dulcis]|uniref:PREDICTED: thioredoxin n=1 Tax=Prunus dulcis TaxID=3755 RepID=A0A5E4FY28_PRUDU|nr:PREDICTED: thioredoxin [Prunus dulcis]